MKFLSVIPARGGSKGIPRKNLVKINGRSLLEYSIKAALSVDQITDLVVSTDDAEIADIARELGAQVPFIRPLELATDQAQSAPVIRHAIEYMENLKGFGVISTSLSARNAEIESLFINIPFEIFDTLEDGIKWAIGWFMGLFGFSEEEIEKATDFDFVKPIRDAVMDAIDWVRDLFRFDGKGVDFSKLAKFIDILLWPLNQAIKWIRKLFGFEEKEGEEFSLGKLITDALNNIFAWFKKLLDFALRISSFKATPGVTNSVTPLLTMVLVCFGSSSWSQIATRFPAFTNFGK